VLLAETVEQLAILGLLVLMRQLLLRAAEELVVLVEAVVVLVESVAAVEMAALEVQDKSLSNGWSNGKTFRFNQE
jgi:hypothetical protein